ncbi:MAG: FAD-dependent oxidoreductase [Acidimicrobiia bacterium]
MSSAEAPPTDGAEGDQGGDRTDFDVIVVGAGPAGSSAALGLARAGRRVCLVERGPFPGAKNMYGGVVYGRVLDTILPGWTEEIPVQRWVVRRSTMLLTDEQALSIDYRTARWGRAPYNGCTTLRPEFDAWLADHAVAAGAELITATTVTGLLREGGRVVGVRTDRPDGDLRAPLVIACDGVNSFLAKEAGLYHHGDAAHFTLGVKEVLALPRQQIEERFALRDLEGADFEIVGCTGAVPGGGFLYTNRDSIAVGVVVNVAALAATGVRAEQLVADLKAHPAIAPLVAGGELLEYSAHLIPEAGLAMMPELATDGMLVAGDAAALCLAAGIWLEGVNFAIGSGWAAAAVADEALRAGDQSAAFLARYRERLRSSFVLADHEKLRRAPSLVLSDRVQFRYPQLLCNLVEAMFTVNNPAPKAGLLRLARREAKRSGVKLRELAADARDALRTFG